MISPNEFYLGDLRYEAINTGIHDFNSSATFFAALSNDPNGSSNPTDFNTLISAIKGFIGCAMTLKSAIGATNGMWDQKTDNPEIEDLERLYYAVSDWEQQGISELLYILSCCRNKGTYVNSHAFDKWLTCKIEDRPLKQEDCDGIRKAD